MLRRRTGVLAALAGLAIGLVVPLAALAAGAVAPEVRSVIRDFRADGTISPCKHSVAALERTSRLSPDEVSLESPDFQPAVEAALEARRHDDCGAGKGGASASAAATARATPSATATATPSATASPATAAPSATATPTPAPSATASASATPTATPQPTATPTATAPPAPTATPVPVLASAGRHDPFPLGLWILAGLLALAALAWLALAVLGRLGWGEERLASPRHAWAEARYRAGGMWSDFSDWLRLGR